MRWDPRRSRRIPGAGILALSLCGLAMPDAGASAQSAVPPVRVQQQPPPCAIATDTDFGITPARPIRLGGGPMYLAARQQRYLSALRGPGGEPVAFKRLGQAAVPITPTTGILDLYHVTYAGLAAPISLYLDGYHYDEPRAPRGFTCVPFGLGPPPIDGFLASDMLVRLAIEQGATRDFAPISLDGDGSAAHGIAFDRFRAIARASKAASAAGAPLDANNPPRDLPRSLILFAYPLACAGRTVAPTSIDVAPPQGPVVRHEGAAVSGDAAMKLVPGFSPPAGAIAAAFALGTLRATDTVRITYADDVCEGASKEAVLPVRFTAARGASLPVPPLPAGAVPGSAPVLLQVLVDVDGLFQQPQYIGGPEALLEPARAAIKTWRAEPARLNGSTVVADTLLLVRFQDR